MVKWVCLGINEAWLIFITFKQIARSCIWGNVSKNQVTASEALSPVGQIPIASLRDAAGGKDLRAFHQETFRLCLRVTDNLNTKGILREHHPKHRVLTFLKLSNLDGNWTAWLLEVNWESICKPGTFPPYGWNQLFRKARSRLYFLPGY